MGEFKQDDDPKQGDQGTGNKGARNKGHLNHPGGDGGQWPDTDNDQSNEGGGGGYKKPLAGDGY